MGSVSDHCPEHSSFFRRRARNYEAQQTGGPQVTDSAQIAEYFAVSSCAAGAWPQIQIVQLCACALIAGQWDVFASGIRTSSASVAFLVLNDL